MKFCTCCKQEKPLDEFYQRKNKTKTGYYHYSPCKVCSKEKAKDYYHQNKEERSAYRKRNYIENREDRLEYAKKYRKENKESIKIYSDRYYKENAEQIRQKAIDYHWKNRDKRLENLRSWKSQNKNRCSYLEYKRKCRKMKAMPSWLNEEQLNEIKEIYEQRKDGEHVDHIIPLKNEKVCGLHVPWNLRIISAKENMRKGNKLMEIS